METKKKVKIIGDSLIAAAIVLVAAWVYGNFSELEEAFDDKIMKVTVERDRAYKEAYKNLIHGRQGWTLLENQKALTAAANKKYEELLKKRPKKKKLPDVCANAGGAVVTDRVLHQMCEQMRSQLKLIGNMEDLEAALIEVNASLEKENKTLETTAKNFEAAAVKFNTAYKLQVDLTGMKVKKEKKKRKGYFIAGVLLGAAVYAVVRK